MRFLMILTGALASSMLLLSCSQRRCAENGQCADGQVCNARGFCQAPPAQNDNSTTQNPSGISLVDSHFGGIDPPPKTPQSIQLVGGAFGAISSCDSTGKLCVQGSFQP